LRSVRNLEKTRDLALQHLNGFLYKLIFEKSRELDIIIEMLTTPAEIENPIPFELDHVHGTSEVLQALIFIRLCAISRMYL